MIRSKIEEAGDIDITPMIDMVFQLIIFFMLVMSIAVVYGVAIKFPPPGHGDDKAEKGPKKKHVNVYVQQDLITNQRGQQVVIRDGILKINGEEIVLTDGDVKNFNQWDDQREKGFDELQIKMSKLIEEKYQTDVLFIQGDMKSYHGKIMQVVDRGKRVRIPGETEVDSETGQVRDKYGFDGFSLVPPQ